MSSIAPNYDEASAKATADGFTVYRSEPSVLLLDLDTEASVKQYAKVRPVLEQTITVLEEERWASKSGNLHIRLVLEGNLEPLHRFALQAALGSDGVREALSIAYLLEGVEEPSLLFRPNNGKA